MQIPNEAFQISTILSQAGYQAYLVGGCVRDLLRGVEPKDWDITTDALPEKILELFPESLYENTFGTVAVKTESENEAVRLIEVTTFREDGDYSNKRHPESVSFTKNIEDDLARRDFTVNAIAINLVEISGASFDDPFELPLIDPYGGVEDLKAGVLRAVGNPEDRFNEDALRVMRAVRFHAQLGFEISEATERALVATAQNLAEISAERIRDEFSKLLMADRPSHAIEYMNQVGILQVILPELALGVGVEQNQHHIYTVFEHNIKSLEYAAAQQYSFVVRLAALLHDVGKPATRRFKASPKGGKTHRGETGDWTFYGHQVVGGKMAKKILERLKFSKEIILRVSLLVHEHMFVYDPDVVTLAGVRRLLSRVGEENLDDLIKVREADRIGSGVPKAQPYRLRYLQAMIEKVKKDPVSAKMLAVNGEDIMKELSLEPGKKLGNLIAILLEEVLDDPEKNTKEILLKRVGELARLEEGELEKMMVSAKKRAEVAQENIDAEIKAKFFVE